MLGSWLPEENIVFYFSHEVKFQGVQPSANILLSLFLMSTAMSEIRSLLPPDFYTLLTTAYL